MELENRQALIRELNVIFLWIVSFSMASRFVMDLHGIVISAIVVLFFARKSMLTTIFSGMCLIVTSFAMIVATKVYMTGYGATWCALSGAGVLIVGRWVCVKLMDRFFIEC